MTDSIDPEPAPSSPDVPLYTCTFGTYNQTSPWSDARSMPWTDLAALLTAHETGPKEGTCIAPATFSGSKRAKADAVRIDVVFLDSDAGSTLKEITAALSARGWRAVISSSHSHLTTTTRAKRGNWDKFRIAAEDQEALPTRFLTEEKGFLVRVAAGAAVSSETDEFTVFEHRPCPKFRVALPLLRPWQSAGYDNQRQANAAWKERIEALAAALGLSHDQACTDTSRLFYLPRRANNAPLPETAILEGVPCDIFALPRVERTAREKKPSDRSRERRASSTKFNHDAIEFVHPGSGERFDLTRWAGQHGQDFQLASALHSRRPEIFVPRAGEALKRHIRCVNESAHTQPGADAATFIVNATDSTSKSGFVYHCRHGHCDGRDRLLFLKQMLEEEWLTIGDLTGSEFLASSDNGVELTEHAVALKFTERCSNHLRFCHTSGAWYFWRKTHWAKNETRLAFHWARSFVATLNSSAELKVRVATGKAAFAGAVERLAQADDTLAVTAAAWDPDPWLLTTPGGVVDLRTGQARPAERTDMATKITAVAPTETVDCPNWLTFLADATRQDNDLASFLQRWFGYGLTGITREHALLFVYGPGGNGKGVMLGTVAGILAQYATTAAMDTFTASQGDRHPTDLAMLRGARLVMTTETEEGRAWAEARIKALTGGDPITARFMRQDFFTFTPAFKLTISGNHKPALRNVDDAARRRFNVVPFVHKPSKPDPDLPEKLKAEWPGILRWMIDGCLAWQRDGLARPKAVIDATAEYFAEQDVLAQWIEECCEQDTSFGCTSAELFTSWRNFATSRAEDPRTAKWFSTMLERQGFRRAKDCQQFRGRGFLGMRPIPEHVSPHWSDSD